MAKFHVGQKVNVLSSEGCLGEEIPPVGHIGTIAIIHDQAELVKLEEYNILGNWLRFDQIQPITETPETLTINGVEYVRKPEPAHEWKFGDIAVHEEYGVGMIFCVAYTSNEVLFAHKADCDWVNTKRLTFLRRADLSV